MAEEPQPADIHEGIDPDANPSEATSQPEPEPEPEPSSSGGADSKKAAAALSSLDARSSDAHDASDAKTPSAADQKALGEAMSRLELLDAGTRLGSGSGSGNAGAAAGGGAGGGLGSAAEGKSSSSGGGGGIPSEREQRMIAERAAHDKEMEERRKVKVDAADVALLVEELELSKAKATELLKAARGDAIKAMTEFVRAGA